MDNKKFNILLILGGILVLVGVSYAYFAATVTGNENVSTISYEAGYLEIELDGGPNVTANRIIPKDTPFVTKTITLTGKNNSNGNMPYNIEIVVDNNTYTTDSITYSIEGTNSSNDGVLIPNMEYIPINNTTIIGSGLFERGNNQVHTYTIKFYFLDNNTDQSANMRASFSAHIKINGEEAEKPAPKNWWKANSTTLLGAIRDNSVVHKDTDEGMTKPGQQIATKDEGLRMALDDYGVSYYFRGAVQNNYVVFARKCWRIVRITGDGSIKLVLHNNDAETCEINDNTLNFAKYDGENFNSQFNKSLIEKTANGIGFMYGNAEPNGSTDYEKYLDAQANLHDSIMLTNLKSWYDYIAESSGESIPTFTNNEKNILADVIWCNDKSLNEGLGYGTVLTYYGATGRTKNPSLECPSIEENNKLSKFTAYDSAYGNGTLNGYKIGLLTMDEVLFAGGKSFNSGANSNYFLYSENNAYWLMTPYFFNDTRVYSSECLVSENGSIGIDQRVSNIHNIRPSIALIPTVTATYDKNDTENVPGSAGNPYVVSVN